MGGTEAAPNRAWRNKVKRQIRQQVKANEGKAGDALAPSARTLYERRHAVLRILDAEHVEMVRGCTCEKATPHTEDGRLLHLTTATTEGITR